MPDSGIAISNSLPKSAGKAAQLTSAYAFFYFHGVLPVIG
jgi:hypothetical protein